MKNGGRGADGKGFLLSEYAETYFYTWIQSALPFAEQFSFYGKQNESVLKSNIGKHPKPEDRKFMYMLQYTRRQLRDSKTQ